ncbi:ATP-dependent helicase [Orenia marismortui]|uniref:DNA 3'-5' helicase n=1 Tax=Orenia marismortui TaxID=46469 RepID=A0A4R8GZK9_9FIRM|nr:UvrD-helicase domain-containing protein [Orenia marismortui]TDX52197.1 DNA helicase-2/ATP-dependent DNA helicase PcrA [Orenia marismortui]
MDLSVDLNDKQLKAVKTTEGPVLVLAGAGSGKTRALTYRIAYLLNQGVDPYNILTLTFTNKAASDMKRKVKELIGKISTKMWMGTFHSVCVRIIGQNLEELGYEKGFVIYDQDESKALISDIILTFNLDTDKYDPKIVLNIINKAKMNMWNKRDLVNNFLKNEEGSQEYYKNIADIYIKYNEVLKENNAFDFNDLIAKTIELFDNNKEILEKYQSRFKYILIDEYQDTSPFQYKLASMLAKKHGNIFVVGDDYQSIYKFRGADMSNILNFNQDYPNCTTIKLEQNYRSKANIIEASNVLIAHNYQQFDKKAWTNKNSGEPLIICEAINEYSEADYVAEEIDNLVRFSGYNYNDIAILYRSNHQSRVLEEAFIRRRIPYHIVGGLGFYDRKEIKDIISYLKVAVNPQDTIAMKRIVNAPKRGIGAKTLDKLITHAQEYVPEFNLLSFAQEDNNLGLFDIMKDPSGVSGIGKATANKIKKFRRDLEDIITVKESRLSLPEQVDKILKVSGYQAMLELDGSETALNRLENLGEFLSLTENYYNKNQNRSLEDFVRDIKLLSDQDDINSSNQVKMMTVHSSKGLEYPIVFIVGLEEDNFPHYRSVKTGLLDEIEEERRLCYVAMTRAADRLFMSYARERQRYGETRSMAPSRFLDEIPVEYTLEKVHHRGL